MNTDIKFDTIYKTYFSKIHTYLTHLMGAYYAEDTAQEVFNKASKKLSTLKQTSKISTWLYRIATNTAIDRMRTLSYKAVKTDTGISKKESNPTGILEKQQILSDQRLIKEQMRSCVLEFIDRLAQKYKTILILKDFEGKTNKEVSQILDLTIDTVKVRYHRAKQLLKTELDSGCTFYYDDENRLQCDRKQ